MNTQHICMYSCIVYIILAIISSHSDLKYWQGLKFYYFLHRVMLTFGLLKVFSGIFHNFSFSFFSKSVVFWLLLCSLFVLMHIGCSSRQLGTPGTGVLLHTGLSACTKQTSALYPAMTLYQQQIFPGHFPVTNHPDVDVKNGKPRQGEGDMQD